MRLGDPRGSELGAWRSTCTSSVPEPELGGAWPGEDFDFIWKCDGFEGSVGRGVEQHGTWPHWMEERVEKVGLASTSAKTFKVLSSFRS